MELVRRVPIGHPDFLGTQFTDQFFVFMLIVNLEVSDEFLRQASTKWLNWRLILGYEMMYFTAHSCIIRLEIIDQESGCLLITSMNKYVYVNVETKRTDLDIPEWVREKTANRLPISMKYDTSHSIPANALTSFYTIQHSDLDFNRHTNNAVYLKVCINAASVHCRNGSFRNFKDTLYAYDICDTSSFFKKESRVDDNLTVYMWQDEHLDHILHFIVKNNDQTVYLCKVTFIIPMKSKY